jgi:transposase
MRGRVPKQPNFFYALNIEDRIRSNHPLRAIKAMVDADLAAMSRRFNEAYSELGRPSVPPERLLKALLLMALYSLRSERELVERIDTDLLFRWFLDMDPAEEAFDATVFTYNRQRLENHGITAAFFAGTVRRAQKEGLISQEHFSADGTIIESFASMKSFVPKEELPKDKEHQPPTPQEGHPPEPKLPGKKSPDPAAGKAGPKAHDSNGFKPRNPDVDFHGHKRSNDTHASRTDPEARLFKKSRGQESKLAHMGHVIGENRHGLVLGVKITSATGTAERQATLELLDGIEERHGLVPRTLGADKGYDAGEFLQAVEARKIIPHVAVRAKKIGGPSLKLYPKRQPAAAARQRAKDRMKTKGYAISQKVRKKTEEIFSWVKGIAGLARTRLVGHWKIQQQWEMGAAGYNLLRIAKLLHAA